MRSIALSLLLLLLAVIAFAKPLNTELKIFINNRAVSLQGEIFRSGPSILVPLPEIAKYLGTEVNYSPEKKAVTLCWGMAQQAAFSPEELYLQNEAYVSIERLAQILGAKLLAFTDALYLFIAQSELLSVSIAGTGAKITMEFSQLAPYQLSQKDKEISLVFFNSILKTAPREITVTQGPIAQIKLYPESPHKIILSVKLRYLANYKLERTERANSFSVTLELSSENLRNFNNNSPRSLTSQTQTALTTTISYHEVKIISSGERIKIGYLKVDYRSYRLAVALPKGGLGSLATLEEMMKASGAVAGINASFFDPQKKMPIGLLLKGYKILSPSYGQRAVLGIDLFGEISFFSSTAPLDFKNLEHDLIRDAISAGPLLLKDGKIVLDPKAEGFSSEFVYGKAARSAIAITYQGELILLVALKDNSSSGMDLLELAQFLQKLGARDAMALDGGSSSSLAFRDGVTLKTIGSKRKIAVGLVLIPRH